MRNPDPVEAPAGSTASAVETAVHERIVLEERLSKLAATAPGVLFSFHLRADGCACFPYASPKLQEMFGLDPAEVVNDAGPVFRRVHPGDLSEFQASIQESARTLSPWSCVFRTRNAHDDYAWTEGRSIPEHCSDGGILWHGFLLDITGRKQAEEQLAAALRYTQMLLQTSPIGIVTYRATGDVVSANPAVAEMIGATPGQVAAQNFRRLESWKDSGLLTAAEAALSTGQRQTVEVTHRSTFGRNICLSSLMVPFEHEGRRHLLAMFVDVTERHRLEQQMERTHAELQRASRLAGMAEVATGVLHNVGNVLNSVNVSSTLIAEGVRDSEIGQLDKVCALLREHETDLAAFLTADPRGRRVPAFLEEIAQHLKTAQGGLLGEIGQLRKYVEHMKEIVSVQQTSAKVSGVGEEVAVTDLVEDALRMSRGTVAGPEVNVIRDFQARPRVTVDRHKVLQILVNLIRNAQHACDDSGRSENILTVRVSMSATTVQIAVADNGVGIPAENLTRIFSHGFTTRKDGHGFGLHNGALAAKELGGSLLAQSDGPGRGATFTLELPLVPEPVHA